jgi:branched-chain amino acid transport system ATP-binding protein
VTTGGPSGGVATNVAAALHVQDLRVARGDRVVLDGVSLDVLPAEITTLLGPNGAGKSSLVLAIAGVVRPVSGSVRIGATEITRARPERVRAAGVAVVPEGRRLLPSLTVEENLKVATFTLSAGDARAGIDSALELFPELGKRLHTTARSLSGGEQQMVVLAQALSSRPKVLVVDELSLGLAPVIVKRLMPVLQQVAADGAGVLLIEQFAHIALELATTAYVLEGGEIRFSGPATELQHNPQLLHSAYLLGGTTRSTLRDERSTR